MKKYYLVHFGSLLLLAVALICAGNANTSCPPKSFESDDIIRETRAFMKEGKSKIIFEKNDPQDIILVLGNSGAGKTTIIKFIADFELEAKKSENGDRILIRDKENQISFGSTIISKTWIPNRFLYKGNSGWGGPKTVFYDLPGFSDTRNSSFDIAKAFFIKMVADHSSRVKLLFVVNHSSLRDGETRSDFIIMLEHATDLIKDTSKFRQGISLAVSKVEMTQLSPSGFKIVENIALFLEQVKKDLEDVISRQCKLKNALNLVDAFLQTSDPNVAQFPRIKLFRQPTKEGPLDGMPALQNAKYELQKMVFDQTQFVPKNLTDFGLTVNDRAEPNLQKMIENAKNSLTTLLTNIVSHVGRHFSITNDSLSSSAYEGVLKRLENFEREIKNLTDVNNSPIKKEIIVPSDFELIFTQFTRLNLLSLEMLTKIKTMFVENLDYFEILQNVQYFSGDGSKNNYAHLLEGLFYEFLKNLETDAQQRIQNVRDQLKMFKKIRQDHDDAHNLKNGNDHIVLILILVCLSLLTVGGVIVTFLWRKNRRLKAERRFLTDEEIRYFVQGLSSRSHDDEASGSTTRQPYNLPYNNSLEVQREQFEFEEGHVLGSGHFGIVMKGFVYLGSGVKETVAIKTVRSTTKVENFLAFLTEIKVMAFLAKHENIACLIAAYTANAQKRQVLAAIEYCSHGDLRHFLLKQNRQSFQNIFSSVDPRTRTSKNCDGDSSSDMIILSTTDLLNFALGIANGMVFLTEKNVVHGDLAARNILLTDQLQVKISDFGFACRLQNASKVTKQGELPFKWLAIEALKTVNLSIKTDIWAFGVTLFEIFTLGETPYKDVTRYSPQFLLKLATGYRLARPELASVEIYNIMQDCWWADPKERPEFSQIYNKFWQIIWNLGSPAAAAATVGAPSTQNYVEVYDV